MDWIKVKTRHIVCDFDLIDPVISWAWVQLMGITATLERIPSEEQMRHKIGNEVFNKLTEVLLRNETSIQAVLEKVMEDVERYSQKKERHKEYIKAQRDVSCDTLCERSQNISHNISHSISHRGDVECKIREDKIREDNIYNEHFEVLWSEYPNKLGKKQAKRHFLSSVKTEKDLDDIKLALRKYKERLKQDKIELKYIQHGSTWFNNWRDWIDWKPTEKPKTFKAA